MVQTTLAAPEIKQHTRAHRCAALVNRRVATLAAFYVCPQRRILQVNVLQWMVAFWRNGMANHLVRPRHIM